jgi:outer membrane protein OmpA-like peptidoglycan-associated protein
MKPVLHTVALAASFVVASAFAQGTQSIQLTPPQARISDEAIQADQKAYETLQGRIKGLNDRGRPVRDYFLSKAQCWLDVSFHEYSRNDRSPFTQEAMTESEKLIVGMEGNVSPLPMDTPLVNGSARLRPDLWDRAAVLRGHAGWRCAAQKAACAEVELVHAGNEYNQQQWRHAKPYVQIAEDLIGEAQDLAAGCVPPPPPPPPPAPLPEIKAAPPVPAPVMVPMPPPLAEQQVQLSAGVLFNFDKHDAKNMRPFSVVQLEELVRKVQREKLVVQSIKLSGHADRLNSTGQNDYNQRLSEKRVATVKAELAKLGIAPQLMSTAASGDSQQIQGCEQRFKAQVDLQECLLPNRRVEVVIEAKRP